MREQSNRIIAGKTERGRGEMRRGEFAEKLNFEGKDGSPEDIRGLTKRRPRMGLKTLVSRQAKGIGYKNGRKERKKWGKGKGRN